MLSLVELFGADGHQLIPAGEGEYKCLCPFHAEKTPSCTIKTDTDKPFFHCFGCGAHGDDVDYLIQARGLAKADAMKAARGGEHTPAAKPKAEPQPKPQQPQWLDLLPTRFTSRHEYRDAEGTLRFCIQRYDIHKAGKTRKIIVPYTRARKGTKRGWVKALAIPKDRPLYRLQQLMQADRAKWVLLVEGEKCADKVNAKSRRALAVTWAGGTNAWKRTDFKPLHDRRVMLVADGDEPGRKCMMEIADALRPHCRALRLVLPPMAAPGQHGRDIADEIDAGTDINAWLREHTHADAPAVPTAPPKVGVINLQADNGRFRVVERLPDGRLLFETADRDHICSRDELHWPLTLMSLCNDLEWWETVIAGGLEARDFTALIEHLFSLAGRR